MSMCEQCSDIIIIINNHHSRHASGGSSQLSKEELEVFVRYACTWNNKRCLCVYKDFKNFDRLTNLVQVILNMAIELIHGLPYLLPPRLKAEAKKKERSLSHSSVEDEPATGSSEAATEEMEDEGEDEDVSLWLDWSIEDMKRLLDFQTSLFLCNFAIYVAHKVMTAHTMEELSSAETTALHNYCEINDIDAPLLLLRNVCFFIDSNGVGALSTCFERANNKNLPLIFAHTLITIITHLRMWVNTPTIMTCILPLRSPIIRYMCTLSEADMRAAAAHNTMELMWQAIKEPMDSQMTFDTEVMSLVYKCFTSTTLTIRLGSICQISTMINTYNENISNESMGDLETFGDEMAKWLLDNKIVEQIFGPNLHIEIIKQSQIILNFLGAEGKINNQHLDCIWAAAQLKHCGKQVYEVLHPLIKSLEPEQNRHLRHLIDKLDPASYNESVLYLSSILTRSQWQAFQAEESHRRKHSASSSGHLSRRSSRPSASHMTSSESESDDATLPPPSKVQRRNPELCHPEEEDHCCSSCVPQLTVHHLPTGHVAPHHPAPSHHPRQNLHHAAMASDSSMEGHSDLSYEEDEEEEVAHIKAVLHLSKSSSLGEDVQHREDESSEEETSPPKQGIPLPSSLSGHVLGVKLDSLTRPLEVKEAALVSQNPIEEVASEEDDEDDEEEEEEEEEMSSDGDDGGRGRPQTREKEQRSERLTRQLIADPALAVQEEEEEEEEEEDDEDDDEDEEEEDEETEEGKQRIPIKGVVHGPDVSEGHKLSLAQEWLGLHQEQMSPKGHPEPHGHVIIEEEEMLGNLTTKDLKPGSYGLNLLRSPDHDEASCHSSGLSTKSEKNMADFDGEKGMSEEELVQINAHAAFNTHQPALATLYHPQTRCGGVSRLKPKVKSADSDFSLNDVCKPGHTLLWDLVQDSMANLLPEGIASEAEKFLTTLLCCSNDRQIRTKFIEAIVDNLAKNKSVVVSLRLLTKLFSSFNTLRPITGSHKVVLWAEKSLNMMNHFFNNLVHFSQVSKDKSAWSSHHGYKEEVSARLVFLSCVFSSQYSPDTFRLSQSQADMLWECLATNPESCEDCLSWFYDQARGKENHAMDLDTFRHIFLNKMPLLPAESMPMIGLNLFQQLSNITCMVNSQSATLTQEQACGMSQLWEIALHAHTKAVSTEAIHLLNNYYINYGGGTLDKEEEFVQRCMNSLMKTLHSLKEDPSSKLPVIQRALFLCKHHLDAFRQRYAYHLRTWQLAQQGISSHQPMTRPQTITVCLQTTDLSEKAQIDMQLSNLVSELRAEVTHWWEELQRQAPASKSTSAGPTAGLISPLLGSMLGEGPLRMISSGQELTVDMDERTLGDLHMTDGQLVFVSVGANRQQRKSDGSVPSACLPVPQRDKLPLNLLIQEPHFDNLFKLLEQLSDLSSQLDNVEKERRASVQAEARRLSRDVWELLMMLPTNESLLTGFMNISTEQISQEIWCQLLPPSSPHRLYYSLQTVEFLAQGTKMGQKVIPRSGAGDLSEERKSSQSGKSPWCTKFIAKGGLSHLMDIFMNGSLQSKEENVWSQWNQECLGYLLRLISQFSVDEPVGEGETSGGRSRRPGSKKMSSSLVMSTISQSILVKLDVQAVVKILMQILFDAAMPMDSNQLYCGTWGRREVVQYAMSFLVSLAFSCERVLEYLCAAENFEAWLKRLTLEAPEAHVRKQACQGLQRLCLGKSRQGKKGTAFLAPILEQLLTFLSDSELFKPKKYEYDYTREEKEVYGAGCHDYFFFIKICLEELDPQQSTINMSSLLRQVREDILNRPYYETHKGYEEDDGLLGLLNVAQVIYKHNPPYGDVAENSRFLEALFDFLFLVPSPRSSHLPKCKSQKTRQATYDLIAEMCSGNMANYRLAVDKFMKQNSKEAHAPYPWEYWPQEDGRSKCGYVGLTNLGATCYMATAVQQLFMIPRLRHAVLQFEVNDSVAHAPMMMELQRMFAYLQESERRAYNPKSFCKTYTMDRCPLNTGEQKDMQEFFTDIITKLEETSSNMKTVIKEMFGGETTNNVVSLDCNHVSRTFEEFYTVRCGVAHMKDLYESLDEVTVKDMLEGDNMYTCSQCHKKVRAEKRTCFRKLPRILCFNTLRYSFNMLTMMKEKVNTHFSFPDSLDMSRYMEHNLIGKDKIQDMDGESGSSLEEDPNYEYKLIGVTVHVGSAEGGHYYNLIKDTQSNKWYHFNDADVKPFDPSNIPHEAFGGEMNFPMLQGKTYDSVSEKYLDFPIEKTNSAYMLFYERVTPSGLEVKEEYNFELLPDLANWIWNDNTQFLKDRSIFDRMYFDHMWQMCSHLPSTLPVEHTDLANHKAVILASCFVLESLIHAKDKVSMAKWIDYLTKKFNSCLGPCEWLLDHMAQDDWWIQHILIKCTNNVIRQMFQRLLIMMITQLSKAPKEYILISDGLDTADLCGHSCLTRFITKLLSNLDSGMRPNNKFLNEYFTFLFEFAKLQDSIPDCPTASFLNAINTISMVVRFYMGSKSQQADYVEILSDEEEDEDVLVMSPEESRPIALNKMISLVAYLVEISRDGHGHVLQLSESDMNFLIRGRGYPFLMYQVRDNINIEHTCNLIVSLCMFNEPLAVSIVTTIFNNIKKLGDLAKPFFDLLTLLTEFSGRMAGYPPFTQLIVNRLWELTKVTPRQCLEWLTNKVIHNRQARQWTLECMEGWVELYMVACNSSLVRMASAQLLVSLVPNEVFRSNYRPRIIATCPSNIVWGKEDLPVMHRIYQHLLLLLKRAHVHVAPYDSNPANMVGPSHSKLMSLFSVLNYCLYSRREKLMFTPFFLDLWQLFHPFMLEPQIPLNHNKQALLMFWYNVSQDCPENLQQMVSNQHVCKNIAFNYILADHEDEQNILFNRGLLPAYYGLLRMACEYSPAFMRQLAGHQNLQWAFKNVLPYPHQYLQATEELMCMMKMMAERRPEHSREEAAAVENFRKNMIAFVTQGLDPRVMWQTLCTVYKILVQTPDDYMTLLYQNGLSVLSQSFSIIYTMFHEATACHMTGDLIDVLQLIHALLMAANQAERKAEIRNIINQWKERHEVAKKLLTLLNSFVPGNLRGIAFDVLHKMVLVIQKDITQFLTSTLLNAHTAFQSTNPPLNVGPFYPSRSYQSLSSKANVRPSRPQFQMYLHADIAKGTDEEFEKALANYYEPYHRLIDRMVRMAINLKILNADLINLYAMVAYEGVPLHLPIFARLWNEIVETSQTTDPDHILVNTLCKSNSFIDYIDTVLIDERRSLNNDHIFQFFKNFFPRVHEHVITDGGKNMMMSLVPSILAEAAEAESLRNSKSDRDIAAVLNRLLGELRACQLILSVRPSHSPSPLLSKSLQSVVKLCRLLQQQRADILAAAQAHSDAQMARREREERKRREEEEKKRKEKSGEEILVRRRRKSSTGESTGESAKRARTESLGDEIQADPVLEIDGNKESKAADFSEEEEEDSSLKRDEEKSVFSTKDTGPDTSDSLSDSQPQPSSEQSTDKDQEAVLDEKSQERNTKSQHDEPNSPKNAGSPKPGPSSAQDDDDVPDSPPSKLDSQDLSSDHEGDMEEAISGHFVQDSRTAGPSGIRPGSSTNRGGQGGEGSGAVIRSQGADIYEKVIKSADAVLALLAQLQEEKQHQQQK